MVWILVDVRTVTKFFLVAVFDETFGSLGRVLGLLFEELFTSGRVVGATRRCAAFTQERHRPMRDKVSFWTA